MFLRRIAPPILAVSMVVGCATHPENIKGTYVSPSVYGPSSCEEIVEERNRIAEQVAIIAGDQKKKATGDAVAMGVGLVVFWPALFLLAAGKDKEAELAAYKGNYDALNQAGVKKGCFSAQSVQPPPDPKITQNRVNLEDDER